MVGEVYNMKYLPLHAKLRVTRTLVMAVVFAISGGVAGYALSEFLDHMVQWPYPTPLRKLVGDNTTSDKGLVEIERGKTNHLRMARLTNFDPNDIDCERLYTRRIVSAVIHNGVYRQQRLMDQYDPKLPLDISGRWAEWKATIDADFTCGDAYLAEDVIAKCNWWHYNINPLTKPTIYTPFKVIGPGC